MDTTGQSCDGGYDYEFVDSPLDRIICVICHLPSRDPFMTECCGHVFCKSCLDKAKAVQRVASCSMCKDKYFKTFCNKQIYREVQGLLVYCTNKGKGCEWEGKVKDIQAHLDNDDGCRFEAIKCPNDCEELIQRQLLSHHVKSECSHREVECQYCSNKVKFLFVDSTHLEECPKLPLPCPNGCGKSEVILREDMEAHKKECPLEMIQCEYHDVGCNVVMPRKRMRKHEQVSMNKHLRLTKAELTLTRDELASTKSELECRVNNMEMMVKLFTGSNSVELSNVCSDPALVASQAKWSIQLAAMDTTSLLDDQMCPTILKMAEFHSYEDMEWDQTDWQVWKKHFFSHERGYRMRMMITPGYDNIDVSLFLMKGPYDENLSWPLRAKFQVKVMNQVTDNDHVSVTLTFDDDTPSNCTQRLANEDDDRGAVRSLLISHENLHKITPSCAYLKNDSILLKVTKV